MPQIGNSRPKNRDRPRFPRKARKTWSVPVFETRYPAVAPCFAVGERVTVRRAAPPGHIRTPFYIRGHSGSIERYCGNFPVPEELAQMRDGLPAQPLYRVGFLLPEVWPDYRGNGEDRVEIEIFQHWLEPA